MSELPSRMSLNRQRIMKSKLKYVFLFIQCQCFDKRRDFLTGKSQRFLKNKGVFLPRNQYLSGIFKF